MRSAAFLESEHALVLAQTSKKFGKLPSERLGILDDALAIDFDNACCLRLILATAGGDADDEEEQWEDVPVERKPPGGSPRARTETIYY